MLLRVLPFATLPLHVPGNGGHRAENHSYQPVVIRIAALAALLIFELALLSAWLDTASLRSTTTLLRFIERFGPVAVNVGVVFAVSFAVFSFRHVFPLFCADGLERRPVVRPLWAAIHIAGFSSFVVVSRIVFDAQSYAGDCFAFAWLILGAVSFLVAPLVFFPARTLVLLFQVKRSVLLYSTFLALTGGIVLEFRRPVWLMSAGITFSAVKLLLALVVRNLVADPATSLIGTTAFRVRIAPSCSGVEGIGLVLAFTCAWLVYYREEFRFPRALILFPAGALAIWSLNAIRIAILILIGNAGAHDMALGGFHSQAGWIGFNIVALGILASSRSWPAISAASFPDEPADVNHAAPYLMPFLALMATGMISAALSSEDVHALYWLRPAAAGLALSFFLPRYRRLDWRPGWLSLVTGVAAFVVWISFSPPRADSTLRDTVSALPQWAAFLWILVRTLGTVIVVPLAEELAFRAFLIRRLISPQFELLPARRYTLLAVVVSSAAFGLMHGNRWGVGVIAGVLYAVVYLRRGRIGDAVVAHAVTNALVAMMVLLGGRWDLW